MAEAKSPAPVLEAAPEEGQEQITVAGPSGRPESLPEEYAKVLMVYKESMRLEWLDPTTLAPNDLNWKRHPGAQRRALSALMDELEERTMLDKKASVGVPWIGAGLYNRRTNRMLDGHMRQIEAIDRGDPFMPVLSIDVDEETENVILRYLDLIGAMYTTDEKMEEVLNEQLALENEVLRALIANQLGEGDEDEEEEEPGFQRGTMPPGGLALALGQKFDYVVLMFKTEVDWNAAQDHFGLERQKCPFSNSVGLGRVVDGAKYLHRQRLQLTGLAALDEEEANVQAILAAE